MLRFQYDLNTQLVHSQLLLSDTAVRLTSFLVDFSRSPAINQLKIF